MRVPAGIIKYIIEINLLRPDEQKRMNLLRDHYTNIQKKLFWFRFRF